MQLISVFALAQGSSFVSSPALSPAPELVEEIKASDECTAEMKVYGYGERNKLDKLFAAMMADAYDRVSGADDLGEIDEDVKALAEAYGVESGVLVASELFAVVSEGCDGHDPHTVTVRIKPTVVENFAGLLRYNGKDWEIVETKLEDGVITFEAAEDAAYTVLLHDGTGKVSSGSGLWIAIGSVAAVAVAAVAVVVVLKAKKIVA
jgi:hypothetical protein